MEVTWGHSGNKYIEVYLAFKNLYYGKSEPLYESNFPTTVLSTINTTLLILILEAGLDRPRRFQEAEAPKFPDNWRTKVVSC
jgi:hypothetical protein